MTKPLGDRRVRVRFDVVGNLWGQLDLAEPARLVNISATGALVDSAVPATLNCTPVMHLAVGGEEETVDTRVRHLRRFTTSEGALRYLIGVEFVTVPRSILESVERMAANVDPAI